jgi:hypothetical protein
LSMPGETSGSLQIRRFAASLDRTRMSCLAYLRALPAAHFHRNEAQGI